MYPFAISQLNMNHLSQLFSFLWLQGFPARWGKWSASRWQTHPVLWSQRGGWQCQHLRPDALGPVQSPWLQAVRWPRSAVWMLSVCWRHADLCRPWIPMSQSHSGSPVTSSGSHVWTRYERTPTQPGRNRWYGSWCDGGYAKVHIHGPGTQSRQYGRWFAGRSRQIRPGKVRLSIIWGTLEFFGFFGAKIWWDLSHDFGAKFQTYLSEKDVDSTRKQNMHTKGTTLNRYLEMITFIKSALIWSISPI